MGRRRTGPQSCRTRATVWPMAPFILTKVLLGICSVIVLTSVAFCVFQLSNDGFIIPWQFVAVAAVTAATFFSVLALGIAFCCRALNPVISMVADGFLWVFWGISGASLAKGTVSNLLKDCNTSKLGEEQGASVCNIYKNMFAWLVIGWITLLSSFIIGAYAHSRQKRGPEYVQANTRVIF